MIHAQATVQLNANNGLHWQTDTDLTTTYRNQVADAQRQGLAVPTEEPGVLNPYSWPHYDISEPAKRGQTSEVFVIRGQLYLRESKQSAHTIMSRWFALGPARQS